MIDTKPKVQLRYPKIKIFLYGTFLCLYLKSSFKNTLFFLEHFINIRIIYNIISLRIKIRFHTIIKNHIRGAVHNIYLGSWVLDFTGKLCA